MKSSTHQIKDSTRTKICIDGQMGDRLRFQFLSTRERDKEERIRYANK